MLKAIYHSSVMITLSVILLAGAQIVNVIRYSASTYRSHGYWATRNTSMMHPVVMIAPKVVALVTIQESDAELPPEKSIYDYINENRSRDIVFALVATALPHVLLTCVS